MTLLEELVIVLLQKTPTKGRAISILAFPFGLWARTWRARLREFSQKRAAFCDAAAPGLSALRSAIYRSLV